MTTKTKEYYIIKKKLNRSWIGNLIGGIILLGIGILMMIFTIMDKINLEGAIIVTLFVLSLLTGSFACFSTLEDINKHKEKKSKIKLQEVKKKK